MIRFGSLSKKLHKGSLASRIRLSYLILIIPIMALLIFSLVNMYRSNKQYESMINSLSIASDFSLDFKKDFDYETYLLIVGNKPVEESVLTEMINHAKWVVEGLQKYNQNGENTARLNSVSKYLVNLSTYKDRIENNLREGNKYDENIEIWENDIQVVTSLVRETFFQYIYYETVEIQRAKTEYQTRYNNIMFFTIIAFAAIIIVIIVASRMLNELLSQVTTEQIRLRKAEFELLQAQINPHFLYNTLDAIVWLAEAGEQQQVVKMVGSLSDFFRTSLNQGKDVVTIREELMHVRSYLEIQHVRYQDILAFNIDVDKSFENSTIPKITLQPIVENALYHGIKNKRGLGHITITARDVTADDIEEYKALRKADIDNDQQCREGDFIISVKDDGIGMTEERLKKVGHEITHMDSEEKVVYGLYNINERIRLNFGDRYGIKIKSTFNEGTCVDVLLPKTNM